MSEHARPAGPGATFALAADRADPRSRGARPRQRARRNAGGHRGNAVDLRGRTHHPRRLADHGGDRHRRRGRRAVRGRVRQGDGRGRGWGDPRARARRVGRARAWRPHDLDRARDAAQGLPDHAARTDGRARPPPPLDVRRRVLDAVLARPRTTARRRAPALEGEHTVDLAIVGAGFTGLWAAVQALEDMPGREVVVLEGERVAFGASGRNGGFCEASLTHGLENGLRRFPAEIERIEQEGRENLEGITAGDRAPRDRLRVGADRHARGRDGAPSGAMVPRRGAASHRVRPRGVVPRSGGRARRGRLAARTSAGSGARTAARASTRPVSPGGSPPRPSGSAPGSTSSRR